MQRYSEKFSIGLTGGIGSGKTTVSDYFTTLGAGVIDADELSRSLTGTGGKAVARIGDAFGAQVINADGGLDRGKLRDIVFNDPAARSRLERILHPMIRHEMLRLAQRNNSAYIVFSIPLLIETQQSGAFDRILVVEAPYESRLQWIAQRSRLDRQAIEKIIHSQTATRERLQHADDVIENTSDLAHLHKQVRRLHRHYLRLAQNYQPVNQ